MVKDYHMNVLAVNYENPFTDPLANENINNAVNILNVDLVKIPDKNQIHKKVFTQNAKTFFSNPDISMVPLLCTACRAVVPYEIHKIAKKNGINVIVNGGNPFEETDFKRQLLKVSSGRALNEKSNRYEFTKGIISKLQCSSKNIGYFKPFCIQPMIKDYLFASHLTRNRKMPFLNTIDINFFIYIEWDEKELLSRIKSELNWKHPISSTWRFDCKVGVLKDFLYINSLNITEKDNLYAKLIRESKITRDEALKRLESENQIDNNEILTLLRSLRYGYQDIEDLIDKLKVYQ
ncbi:MAG: ATPase [Methanosarcina vacuolata]|jgi:hypothetical protein|nr:ATPase [Methanosarcina vacuolata]